MNETTKKESRQMDMLHGKIFKNMLIKIMKFDK